MANHYLITLVLLLTALVQQKPGIKLPAPPDGIRLKENLYMDKTELSNAHWSLYLQYLRQDSSAEAWRRALPDTTVWDEADRSGVLKRVYFRNYRYRFHPVVGISYEQAEAYNAWRSAMATNAYNSNNKKRLTRHGFKNYKVVFRWRLPTINEWETAASGGLNPVANPYGVSKKRYKSLPFDNTIIYDSLRYTRPELAFVLRQHLRRNPIPGYNCINTFGNGFRYGLYITNPVPFVVNHRRVIFTRANGKGFYDMVGNVAEMVSEKGKAKGGSWMHYMEYSKIRLTQNYTAPAAWLGFRSVCEVSLEPI